MHRFNLVCGLAALSLLAGCATAPQVYDVQRTMVVPESKDVVWERVVEFFATNNLPIKAIEKDSGIISAERMIGTPGPGGKIGTWADCGSELLMTPISQGVDLNVFVRTGTGGTSVTVNTNFTETRTFDGARSQVTCNSTGALEAMLLAAASGR